MMMYAYRVLCWLIVPIAMIRIFFRSLKESSYRDQISERFGLVPKDTKKDSIWVHAVSVGEVLASQQLIERLHENDRNRQFIITCATPTGKRTALKNLPSQVQVFYAPFDILLFVRSFLSRTKPRALLVMETEIWPNMFNECSQRSIPIYMINARISERSLKRYQRFSSLTKSTLNCVTSICAQSEGDLSRFKQITNTEIHNFGNLKYERDPNAEQIVLGGEIISLLEGQRRVIVAASTHEGEEIELLKEFKKIESENILLIIIPRHPNRFQSVASLIKDQGFKLCRRSDNKTIPKHGRVMLGDSLGEMYAYYFCANAVIMGGSFVRHGGQNPLEALTMGKYVIMGPHTYNFSEIVEDGIRENVIFRARNVSTAIEMAYEIAVDTSRQQYISNMTNEFIRKKRGALDKTIRRLESDSKLSPKP